MVLYPMAIVVGDENPPILAYERAVVTWTIILVNVFVFFIGVIAPWILVPGAHSFEDIVIRLGMIPALIIRGQELYRLVTSMFIHAGLTHLFGNMLFLFVFGDNIEFVMGKKKFLLFYILSGIWAHVFYIASLLLTPSSAIARAIAETGINPWWIPAVGASGAISGVLGAYALLFPYNEIRLVSFIGWIPIPIRLPAIVFIGIWFFFQLIWGFATMLTGVQVGIAFWAHVGGFVGGLAMTKFFIDKRRLDIMNRYWYIVES